MIAMHGKGFLSSAKDAFFLLADNGIRALVLNSVTDFLMFLSRIAVTSTVGVAAYYIFTNQTQLVYFDLNFYWFPLTVS